MTVADDAIAAAFHFEGKLYAFRKAASGIVVSFLLEPADVPPQIALAPLGTRYTLALVERGDNEEPLSRESGAVSSPDSRPAAPTPMTAPPGAHIKDPWESMAAERRHAEAGTITRLIAKAAILARDPRFQRWVGGNNEKEANDLIVAMCGITRKRDFYDDERARERFGDIVTDYEIHLGRLPEPR